MACTTSTGAPEARLRKLAFAQTVRYADPPLILRGTKMMS